jgi:hypothetical protein
VARGHEQRVNLADALARIGIAADPAADEAGQALVVLGDEGTQIGVGEAFADDLGPNLGELEARR